MEGAGFTDLSGTAVEYILDLPFVVLNIQQKIETKDAQQIPIKIKVSLKGTKGCVRMN